MKIGACIFFYTDVREIGPQSKTLSYLLSESLICSHSSKKRSFFGQLTVCACMYVLLLKVSQIAADDAKKFEIPGGHCSSAASGGHWKRLPRGVSNLWYRTAGICDTSKRNARPTRKRSSLAEYSGVAFSNGPDKAAWRGRLCPRHDLW